MGHNGVLVWCSYCTPIISWNVLHQCGWWAPPFVIICSSSGQTPKERSDLQKSTYKCSRYRVCSRRGWWLGEGRVPTRPLFSIIQPLGGTLDPPLPAPGPRPGRPLYGQPGGLHRKAPAAPGLHKTSNQPGLKNNNQNTRVSK